MSINDRFKQIMERENLTAQAFAETIGVSQATISHILSGRNKMPSTEVILRLHESYGKYNLEWLMTGQGAMITGEEACDISRNPPTDTSDYPLIASDVREFAHDGTVVSNNRKEMAVNGAQNGSYQSVKQEIVYKERPPRKITEIRIFFDDNTYETFTP